MESQFDKGNDDHNGQEYTVDGGGRYIMETAKRPELYDGTSRTGKLTLLSQQQIFLHTSIRGTENQLLGNLNLQCNQR